MKIIEALKEVKALKIKITDLSRKIQNNSAHREDVPTDYKDPAGEIKSWQTQIHHATARIESLLVDISITNLKTIVTINIGGREISKPIAAWVHRVRTLAALDATAWQSCTNRNLRMAIDKQDGNKAYPVILNYDTKIRDTKVEEYTTEPALISTRLETVNALTDLVTSL